MRAMARWLMAVIGLLAVLSVARIAIAADTPTPDPVPADRTPGIADEIETIRDAYAGRDRGDAASDAAHRQADSVGRDTVTHGDDKEPVDPPGEGGGGK